jgi:hypothetical protein
MLIYFKVLDLLADERVIIKQGSLKKTAALDSTNYQLVLLDNFLLITKLKVVGLEEHYTIQRKVRWQYRALRHIADIH